MARYKDVDWTLNEDQIGSWQQVEVAVLMDIRDELKLLNSMLRCPNFQQIPAKLDAIRKNTAKPRKVTK